MLEIYTDGSCLGNPGAGGWAAILLYKEHQKKVSGGKADTTNNQMELTAVIEALKALKKSSEVTIYIDSQYVKNGITEWVKKWKVNGWRTADKKPVKNVELWKDLDDQVSKHQIKWQWVKAHNGNKYNEIVDELARFEAMKVK